MRAALATRRISRGLEPARELIELGELGGELQLELRGVDALALRDHQARCASSTWILSAS